jgi:hypothetical protein
MHPFPEEDELELGEVHSGRAVDLSVLGRLLVEVEGALPVRVAERRNRPADQFPFGDRKAAFGQPGDAADHDHGEDQGRHEKQPAG